MGGTAVPPLPPHAGGSALPPLPPYAYLENCQYWKMIGKWYKIEIPRIIAAI